MKLVSLPALLAPVNCLLRVSLGGPVVAGGEVNRDAVPARTEQSVNRHSGSFPGDIPESYIDRTHGYRADEVRQSRHAPPVHADIQRSAPSSSGLMNVTICCAI